MSIVSEQATGEFAVPSQGPPGRGRHRRRKLAVAGAVIAVIAGAAGAATARLAGQGSQAPAGHGIGATALATVTERSLSSQTQVNATLGYASSYSVVFPAAGGDQSPPAAQGSSAAGQPTSTVTALPAVGKVVRQGRTLYSVNGAPVVLLIGSTPAYRSLSAGMTGTDVRQLNGDLVKLGYATRSELDPSSSFFSAATASAVARLQARLGVTATGGLALGQAVFLPTAARVISVSATLGAPAQPGAPVLQATSTRRQVTAQLDATQQSEVKRGDKVTITLPNNRTTPGVVTSVGTVASAPNSASGGPGGSSGGSSSGTDTTATIQVNIRPTDPSATGKLTQAPVQVTITTVTVQRALVVPIDALLTLAGGGYAVEVVGTNGAHRLVPVSLGLFDDAEGLVQVTGSRLAADQSVVVPKL